MSSRDLSSRAEGVGEISVRIFVSKKRGEEGCALILSIRFSGCLRAFAHAYYVAAHGLAGSARIAHVLCMKT